MQKQKEIAKRFELIKKIQNRITEAYNVVKKANVVLQKQENIEYTEYELSNNEIFRTSIGDRILKKDVKQDGIPMYSANVLKPFGFSNDIKYEIFEKPVIIWGIDGDFNYNIIPVNTKFIPTDHCGVLEVNSNEIDIECFLYELKATKLQYGFDRTYRASLENIKNVSVKIPKDIQTQKIIAQKYKIIEKIQNHLIENLKILKDCIIIPNFLEN